jgi:hypothetical protein
MIPPTMTFNTAQMTNVLLSAFGGLVSIMLAVIGFLLAHYVKRSDRKFDLLFKELGKTNRIVAELIADYNWLMGHLNGKGCIDGHDNACSIMPDAERRQQARPDPFTPHNSDRDVE